MAEGKFAARDIQGLTPAIDPTQTEQLFALEGRNYVFDSLGVKSPFGNRLLTPVALTNPNHVQSARIRLRSGDRCFHFTAFGIVEWNESAGGWEVIYWTQDTTIAPYRWTYEYLNNYLYFAHPSVGLLVLNLDTNRCDPHEVVGKGTPEQVIAVSQNNGRLVVLTQTLLTWSAPSNGLNFVPTLGGAGFQVLAERVAGDAIGISTYARGIMTWTSGGVMRSEFSGDQAVFRHRTLNTEYRPINSFCVLRVDVDVCVILDERGLFRTQGEALEPYAPVFNEFLIGFLQDNDYREGHSVRLEWDDLQRRLYLSYSDSYADPIYEKCFVYYPPLDKWGEFNESHYGICPFIIKHSERADDYFGFIDSEGRPRYWLGTGSREVSPESSEGARTANLFIPELAKPSQHSVEDDGMLVSSTAKLRVFDATHITGTEGYYAPESSVPIVPEVQGLDAFLRFGYIRLNGEGAADEMMEITSVIIRSVKSGDSDVLREDFNLIPDGVDNEDYNTAIGHEDLGLNPLNYVTHSLALVGTIDADTDFMRVTPELSSFARGVRMWACSVVGLWHIVEIGAESVGDAFHIRTFEITGTSAGRYL